MSDVKILSLTLILILLFSSTGKASRLADDSFVLRRKTTAAVEYYGENPHMANTMGLLLQDNLLTASSRSPMLVPAGTLMNGEQRTGLFSQGKSAILQIEEASIPSPVLRLSMHNPNPIWSRWRYAILTNFSLTMSRTSQSANADAKFKCAPETNAFCTLGTVPMGAYDASGMQDVTFPPRKVVIDLSRERGLLPPDLYQYFTKGSHTSYQHSGFSPQPNITLNKTVEDAIKHTRGLIVGNDLFRLTSVHQKLFDLAAGDQQTVVIGSLVWNTNVSMMEIDGQTATVSIYFAQPQNLAVQWIVFIMAIFLILLVGRWLLGQYNMVFGFLMKPEALRRRWPINHNLVLATIAVLACLTVVIVCAAVVIPGALPHDTNFRNDFVAMLAVLAGYIGFQFLLLVIAWVMTERPRNTFLNCTSDKPYTVSLPVAAMRHFLVSTMIWAGITLCTLVYSVDGAASGSTLGLFYSFIPAMILVYHHTYYTILILVVSFLHRDGNRCIGYPGFFVIGLLEAAIEAVFLLLLLSTIVTPATLLNNVLFSSESATATAVLLAMLPASMASLVIIFESAESLKALVDEKLKKKQM